MKVLRLFSVYLFQLRQNLLMSGALIPLLEEPLKRSVVGEQGLQKDLKKIGISVRKEDSVMKQKHWKGKNTHYCVEVEGDGRLLVGSPIFAKSIIDDAVTLENTR